MTEHDDPAQSGRDARPVRARRRRWTRSVPPSKWRADDEWMMTYMDVVTLLVTLFVVLLSFSTINTSKFKSIASAMSLAKYGAGIVTGGLLAKKEPQAGLPKTLSIPKPAEKPKSKPEPSAMAQDLRSELAKQGLSGLVSMTVHENVVDLQLSEAVLFQTGDATLTDQGQSVVQRLEPLLTATKATMDIQGHTDDIPISTDAFPSNWELSAARAASVARALIAHGITKKRIHISGYADTRPVASNDTPDGRSRNRRVTIVLKMGDKAKVN